MQQRRQYDCEFKAQAVQLCEQEGIRITQIARELGVDVKLLYRWRSEAQRDGKAAFPGQGHAKGDEGEIRRLQRELARVEMERDILKKALGVLAQPSK
jgi:transposase